MEVIRLYVTGNYNSGKTRFVRTISEIDIVNVGSLNDPDIDKMPVVDFGRVSISDDEVMYFFSTPGFATLDPVKYAPIVKKVKDYRGIIVMVDSIQERSIARILGSMDELNYPYVIAANKQDLPGALSPEEIRNRLQIPNGISVLPCIATERDSVKSVLLLLLKQLQLAEVIQNAIKKIESL